MPLCGTYIYYDTHAHTHRLLHREPRVGGGDARQLESLAVQEKLVAAILLVHDILPIAIPPLILLRLVDHHVKNAVFT